MKVAFKALGVITLLVILIVSGFSLLYWLKLNEFQPIPFSKMRVREFKNFPIKSEENAHSFATSNKYILDSINDFQKEAFNNDMKAPYDDGDDPYYWKIKMERLDSKTKKSLWRVTFRSWTTLPEYQCRYIFSENGQIEPPEEFRDEVGIVRRYQNKHCFYRPNM